MSGPDTNSSNPPKKLRHHLGMEVIAIFKLIKGVLLLAAAIGIFKLINRDLNALVEHWVTVLRMDPDSAHIHRLLERVADIDPQLLRKISVGSFFYSVLLLTEGVGLWFEWRWAEYLTIIATASFIPLELYELALGYNFVKFLVLGINLAIVFYLVVTLRRDRKAAKVGK